MTNVYSAEYLKTHEIYNGQTVWGYSKYPDAQSLRNAVARQLRKDGWTVKIFTYSDFCGLEAERAKIV